MFDKPMFDKPTLTSAEAAERLGVSVRRMQEYLLDGRIQGAARRGRDWVIPDPPRLLAAPRLSAGADKRLAALKVIGAHLTRTQADLKAALTALESARAPLAALYAEAKRQRDALILPEIEPAPEPRPKPKPKPKPAKAAKPAPEPEPPRPWGRRASDRGKTPPPGALVHDDDAA